MAGRSNPPLALTAFRWAAKGREMLKEAKCPYCGRALDPADLQACIQPGGAWWFYPREKVSQQALLASPLEPESDTEHARRLR